MDLDTSTVTPEKPVFAATSDARPRALKLLGRGAAALVGLWLLALVLGAFGFGHVPGFQLPRIVGQDHPKSAKGTPEPAKPRTRAPVAASPAARVTSPARGAHRPSAQNRRSGTSSGPRRTGSAPATGGTRSGGTSATPAPAATATPPISSPSRAHSNTTAPGSSSTTPGSRSQATTAPGRGQSQATPTPGQGKGSGKATTG